MNVAPQLLLSLFAQCSPNVAPETLSTLIDVESSRNPYAIAVVYDKNTDESDKFQFSQPTSQADALAIIEKLEKTNKHKSYSVGIMQVNSSNFKRYGINKSNMFDACKNIETGSKIFAKCFATAQKNNPTTDEQILLRNAASCYYSGNEIRGYQPDAKDGTSYIDRINRLVAKTYKVPAIKPLNDAENDYSQQSQAQPKSSWDIFGDFKQ